MSNADSSRITGGELLLDSFSRAGINYIFANLGTDYPAVLEALAERHAKKISSPKLIVVPHEMVAVSMAHGYAAADGKPQAVMVHTLPGTANALGGILNASRSMVPMIIHAGRTPVTEQGVGGSRSVYIHWAQESRDQASIVREFVKWDFEIRYGHQIPEIVMRALKVAMTEPKGPVYISFPRELTVQQIPKPPTIDPTRYVQPSLPQADSSALEKAAELLIEAQNPMIVTKNLGRDTGAVAELVKLANLLAIPVSGSVVDYVNFPNTHSLAVPSPQTHADVILVIDSDLPWLPSKFKPDETAKIIHLDIDPSHAAYTVWGFPAHLAITGSSRLSLPILYEFCKRKISANLEHNIENRREKIEALHDQWRSGIVELTRKASSDFPINTSWLSHCIGKIKDNEMIIINEYPFNPDYANFEKVGTYFFQSSVSCLGWGLGAAMGVKLAKPGSIVCATVGDGAYMFGNPTASHFVATSCHIPVITIIYNNECWGAVRRAVREHYPDGWFAKSGNFVGSDLKPSPKYELAAESHGIHAREIIEPKELEGALKECVEVVKGGRSALLNVKCASM